MRTIAAAFCLLALASVAACVPVSSSRYGYGGYYGSSYRQPGGYYGYDSLYTAPAVMDRPGYNCYAYRDCPMVMYYSDTNPDTQKRLSRLEAKVEKQSEQILALAENDKALEEGYRLMVAYMRKYRMTLDQVVEQNKLVCERFLAKPESIKDEQLRAKQEKFCKALIKATADNGLVDDKSELE